MNIIKRKIIAYEAKGHANLGIDAGEEQVTASLGPRPQLDATGNLVHAGLISRMNNLGPLQDHREEVERLERQSVEHPSTVGLSLGLVFLFVAECVGSVLLMRSVGFENPERLVLGVMLAMFIYFLTWLAAKSTADGQAQGPVTPGQRFWFWGPLAVYAILLLAVAAIRVGQAVADGGSPFEDIAAGVVMLATSVGPAAISEVLMRRRGPAVRLQKELALARQRLKEEQMSHDSAEKQLSAIVRAGSDYDSEAAQQAAIYAIEQKVARARRGSGQGGAGDASAPLA